MKDELEGQWPAASVAATDSPAAARRLHQHLRAALLCPERLTLSNLLCTSGGQHADWSADCRLYSRGRLASGVLFDSVRASLHARLPAESPLVVSVDDTLVRKTGTKIAGVSWKPLGPEPAGALSAAEWAEGRDPLGPAFQTHFVRGQRCVQFSAAWPRRAGRGAAAARRLSPRAECAETARETLRG